MVTVLWGFEDSGFFSNFVIQFPELFKFMKVLKFGGTSVGTVDSLHNVKKIVESQETPVVVVVSALGGLTDNLIATARLAASGSDEYLAYVEAIANRHRRVIEGVVDLSLRQDVLAKIEGLLADLRRYYDGVYLLRDLPSRILDVIVSFGERMSSIIVTAMIDGAVHHDSLKFIKTEKWFSKDIADQNLASELIAREFTGIDHIAVCPGFISTDKDSGEITNLGRGGSDFTAALIASALNADMLEIWTDVDGFMTADPRIIKDAIVVPHMTFIESMELCSFGAKVIYPPTIYPVFHKNIPIKILNTFNPDAPGTEITDSALDSDFKIKGVSAVKDTAMFTLRGEAAENMPSINSRSFNAMARKGIKVFLVSQPSETGEFSFSVSGAEAGEAYNQLMTEFAPEITSGTLSIPVRTDNLATVAIVGADMKNERHLGPRMRNTLSRHGIKVWGFSDGVSDTTKLIVVGMSDLEESLKLVHQLLDFH